MIYDVKNLISGLGGIENTREAIAYFREQTKRAGFPDLHLQITIWGEKSLNLSGFDSNMQGSTKEIVALLGADSVTHYQFVHFTDVDRDYRDILSDVKEESCANTVSVKMGSHKYHLSSVAEIIYNIFFLVLLAYDTISFI